MIKYTLLVLLVLLLKASIVSQKFKAYLWSETTTSSHVIYTNDLYSVAKLRIDSIVGDISKEGYRWVLFYPEDTTVNYSRPSTYWLKNYIIKKGKIKSNIDNGKLFFLEYIETECTELYSIEIKKGKFHGRFEYYEYRLYNGLQFVKFGYYYKGKREGIVVSFKNNKTFPHITVWKKGKPMYGYGYYKNGNKESELNNLTRESKRWSIDGELIFFVKLKKLKKRVGIKEVVVNKDSSENN